VRPDLFGRARRARRFALETTTAGRKDSILKANNAQLHALVACAFALPIPTSAAISARPKVGCCRRGADLKVVFLE